MLSLNPQLSIPIHKLFRVASSQKTDPEILVGLLSPGKNSWVRNIVCKNPSTPIAPVLTLLQECLLKRVAISQLLLLNPSPITAICLEKEDLDTLVQSIAQHPLLPINYQEKLSHDSSFYVRTGVAKNPSTAPKILEKLSRDKSNKVRIAVASNPKTPYKILISLVKGSNTPLKISLARNQNLPKRLSFLLQDEPSTTVRYHLAQNQHADKKTLTFLSKAPERFVRERVAANPKTPSSVLEKLLKERSTRIRRAVINNLSTPTSILLTAQSKRKIPKTLEDSFRERIGESINL